jgi:transcriptional regulator with XRE-family HTH domain
MTRLKYFRELTKNRQSDIADVLHITSSAYAKIERGEARLREEHAKTLANFYKISIASLMNDNNTEIVITEAQYLDLIKTRNTINDIERAVEENKKQIQVTLKNIGNGNQIRIGNESNVIIGKGSIKK